MNRRTGGTRRQTTRSVTIKLFEPASEKENEEREDTQKES
jgi:hypothetical protein